MLYAGNLSMLLVTNLCHSKQKTPRKRWCVGVFLLFFVVFSFFLHLTCWFFPLKSCTKNPPPSHQALRARSEVIVRMGGRQIMSSSDVFQYLDQTLGPLGPLGFTKALRATGEREGSERFFCGDRVEMEKKKKKKKKKKKNYYYYHGNNKNLRTRTRAARKACNCEFLFHLRVLVSCLEMFSGRFGGV